MNEPTTYDVVLLVEQPLSAEDAAARVESAMGSIAASEVLASPALVMDSESIQDVQRELLAQARSDCDGCVSKLKGQGADVSGEVVSGEPVEAPEGTAASPKAPDASPISTSTVGFPRESRISRALTSTMLLTIPLG